MNGFEKHNIKHLSASSINLFSNAPDVWVAKYILGHKQSFGPAPRRGQVVEDAVAATLCGESITVAIDSAIEDFNKDFDFLHDDAAKADKERDLIKPMTEIAVEELKDLGHPKDTGGAQEKIETAAIFDDWSVPIIGFLDFEFESHGLVVDLKTTTRVPNKMSPEHQLQRALYTHAKGNMAVKFLYVSAKKANWLEDGNPAEILANAKVQIARMEKLLAAHTADSMKACIPVLPNSFYWRGDEEQRKEIYGV